MDVYRPSTLIAFTLRNRLVPTVNDSVNFSYDKLHEGTNFESLIRFDGLNFGGSL